MIKRTLYFSNPCYLHVRHGQLMIEQPAGETYQVPIEDTAIIILDHERITFSQTLLAQAMEQNVAVICCDSKHHPVGLWLPLDGNNLQSARFQAQIRNNDALKDELWRQTVVAKLTNQAAALASYGLPHQPVLHWARNVQHGDPDNLEGRGAAHYWKHFFTGIPDWDGGDDFTRERGGFPPNNLLNYAYAILRATVARGLVASGMLPTLGIFHKNQYNAYCLADDIMEPYRPFADCLVRRLVARHHSEIHDLTPEVKQKLLGLPTLDITIGGKKSPLMVGLQQTTASLVKCFEGSRKTISYPSFSAT